MTDDVNRSCFTHVDAVHTHIFCVFTDCLEWNMVCEKFHVFASCCKIYVTLLVETILHMCHAKCVSSLSADSHTVCYAIQKQVVEWSYVCSISKVMGSD